MIHNEDENTNKAKKRRGDKLNIWGAISYNGEISLEIFEENLSSENYIQILSSKLEEKKIISKSNRILIQIANCRVHWSLELLKIYHENKIKILDWSSYSPNLNSRENIFGQ